jgi:hypothetical protein
MKLVIGLIVVVAGCGGSKEGGGGGAVASNMPDEVGSWMPKNATDVWQGAWSTRLNLSGKMSMSSPPAALDIKGDGAKAFDGKTEHPLGFEIDSPCTVAFKQPITEGAMKGGTSTHSKQFLIKDGKLLAGEGAVGMRKGKTAIACMIGMDSLATLDDAGKCKSWSHMMDRWSSKDTTCKWSNEGGKDILTVGTGNWTSKLIADGDLLMNEQFADEVKKESHKKMASYDAAKQVATDGAKK